MSIWKIIEEKKDKESGDENDKSNCIYKIWIEYNDERLPNFKPVYSFPN